MAGSLENMTKEEAEQHVAPKKCPVCEKECVLRKGGWRGWFRGCPDFPECPGKVGKNNELQKDQEELGVKKLTATLAFIKEMGGTENAIRWVKLGCEVVSLLIVKKTTGD